MHTCVQGQHWVFSSGALHFALCVYVLYVCLPCVYLTPMEVRREHQTPRPRAVGSSEPPCTCRELGPPKEQWTFLTRVDPPPQLWIWTHTDFYMESGLHACLTIPLAPTLFLETASGYIIQVSEKSESPAPTPVLGLVANISIRGNLPQSLFTQHHDSKTDP